MHTHVSEYISIDNAIVIAKNNNDQENNKIEM